MPLAGQLAPLPRRATVTAAERCAVLVLDTVGWAAEGGLSGSLAAAPPLDLSPRHAFWLRFLAGNAPDCRGGAASLPGLRPRSPYRANPWGALFHAAAGSGAVDADAVVASLLGGPPCDAAADALRAVPSMLQHIAAPLRCAPPPPPSPKW